MGGWMHSRRCAEVTGIHGRRCAGGARKTAESARDSQPGRARAAHETSSQRVGIHDGNADDQALKACREKRKFAQSLEVESVPSFRGRGHVSRKAANCRM